MLRYVRFNGRTAIIMLVEIMSKTKRPDQAIELGKVVFASQSEGDLRKIMEIPKVLVAISIGVVRIWKVNLFGTERSVDRYGLQIKASIQFV